jgi:hypothetical protein
MQCWKVEEAMEVSREDREVEGTIVLIPACVDEQTGGYPSDNGRLCQGGDNGRGRYHLPQPRIFCTRSSRMGRTNCKSAATVKAAAAGTAMGEQ